MRLPGLTGVAIDLDLLEQALDNLLDNAAKYSDVDTTVTVFGEVAQNRTLTIVGAQSRHGA